MGGGHTRHSWHIWGLQRLMRVPIEASFRIILCKFHILDGCEIEVNQKTPK